MPASGSSSAGQHLEQRRLAGAVRAAQADAIAVADLPGDVIEQRAVAEGLGEFGKLNHAAGAPRASGRRSSTCGIAERLGQITGDARDSRRRWRSTRWSSR